MYKFLWNVRLWLKGCLMIALFPFVMLWKLFVKMPIEWAKEYESERKE